MMVRTLKISSGTSGSADRRSTRMTALTDAAVMVIAPGRSSRGRGPSSAGGFGTSTGASRAAPRPTGTLTKKTHRQSSRSVRMPPRITPETKPKESTAPYAPSAQLRSVPSLNDVVSRDRAAGATTAAPRPCRPRSTTSWAAV